MFRIAVTMSLALILAGGAAAVDFTSDLSTINLLERWNTNGTYGVTTTIKVTHYTNGVETGWDVHSLLNGVWTVSSFDANANPTSGPNPSTGQDVSGADMNRIQAYARGGNAPRFQHSRTTGVDKLVEITYTFDADITVDRLVAFWSSANHSPTNYAWYADGVAVPNASVARPDDPFDPVNNVRLDNGTYEHVLSTPVTARTFTFTTYLEGRTDIGVADLNWYHCAELHGLGIYLADGYNQKLALDGTYNIFYQEVFSQEGKTPITAWTDPNREGQPDVPYSWTDCHEEPKNGAKPPNDAGSCTWVFDNTYELYGMILTQFDQGRHLAAPLLEVSTDGENWLPVWGDGETNYVWKSDVLYIPFASDEPILASQVRLSWGDHDGSNSGVVEITQFQLFGRAIPEPATMTLLALGGLAMLRRRR